jgi:3D (Asp-Asp-Asp) domain-containing protein
LNRNWKSTWRKVVVRSAPLLLGGTLLIGGTAAHAAPNYTAIEGDTFWLLSKRYGIPLQQLLDANPGINPLNIYGGLKLTLPGVNTGNAANTAANATKASANTATMTAASTNTVKANNTPANAAKANGASNGVASATVKTASGQVLSYSKVLNVTASAYSASVAENPWGAIDYFGNPLTLGTIAVDPKVIPFGSKVYITGYQFSGLPQGGMIGYATDAGGAIRGNRIDIFVPGTPAEVYKFGFQNVKVYLLD